MIEPNVIDSETEDLLTLQTTESGGWVVIAASGEIDLSNAEQISDQVIGIAKEDVENVALDLREVSFMDSTGLRHLLIAHERLLEYGARFVVLVDGGPVDRLLEITGLRSVIDVRSALPG